MQRKYAFIRALGKGVMIAQMRLRVDGVERAPVKGPLLLISNHLGRADPLVIGVSLSREIRMLGKIQVFGWFLLGGVARMVGAVPIRRGESDREALQGLLRLLDAGECLLLFPEGTYAHAPGTPQMSPLQTGAAWLALRGGCPVVPVGVWGTERPWHWSRGWRPWQRRPRVQLVVGEPYIPQPPPGAPLKVALRAVADEMGQRIAALLPEAYRGVYANTQGLGTFEKISP